MSCNAYVRLSYIKLVKTDKILSTDAVEILTLVASAAKRRIQAHHSNPKYLIQNIKMDANKKERPLYEKSRILKTFIL